MYAVISYWVGEYDQSKMWLYETKEEAKTAMQRLYNKSFSLAKEDTNFDEDSSYHDDYLGCVAWEDGLYRFFEVVCQEEKEELI